MFNLRYLLAMCLFLTPVTVLAEITGSGFHELGCPGSVSATVWLDQNSNGLLDADEQTLPGVKLAMFREDSPELGTGEIFTDADGFNSFDALCDGAFILSIDAATTPADVQFDHLYPELQVDFRETLWRVYVQTGQGASQSSGNKPHLELALQPSSCDAKLKADCCRFERGGVQHGATCLKPVKGRKLLWNERRSVEEVG